MRASVVTAALLLLAGGVACYRGADNRLVLGFTDAEGRHYPRGPPMGTIYHYPDDEVSNQLTRHNSILPTSYSNRLTNPSPWRHHKPGYQSGRARGNRKHNPYTAPPQALHQNQPAPARADVYRTSQWGSVRIPYAGASVNVPVLEGSRKAQRGSITTTVYSPAQPVLAPRKVHPRQGDRHQKTDPTLLDTVQDAPVPSSSATGPCIRCPGDRAVVANRGRDMVLVEQPELRACSHRPHFKLPDLRMEWIQGPKPGTLAAEGTHIMVGRVMYKHHQLQTCRLRFNVVVRKCPPLILPKHMTAVCTDGNIWGSTCHMACQNGYHLQGHNATECSESLLWTHPLASCEALSGCPMPMSPEHGRLSCKTSSGGEGNLLPEETICRYECDAGYAIPQYQAQLTVISCSKGDWNSTVDPSCQDINLKMGNEPEILLNDGRNRAPRRRHRNHRVRATHRTLTDPCHPNPCQDGGTCLRGPRSATVVCLCQHHREGEFCQRARCQDELCENGGRCMKLGQQSLCYCPAGYSGINCQIKDAR